MLKRDFMAYLDAVPDDTVIGIEIRSIETGAEIALSFDIVLLLCTDRELKICVQI